MLLPTIQTGTSHPLLPFRSRVGRRFPEIKAEPLVVIQAREFPLGRGGEKKGTRKGGWLKKCGIKGWGGGRVHRLFWFRREERNWSENLVSLRSESNFVEANRKKFMPKDAKIRSYFAWTLEKEAKLIHFVSKRKKCLKRNRRTLEGGRESIAWVRLKKERNRRRLL